MGDEYGSTFVMKEDEKNYCLYRIDDVHLYWDIMNKIFSEWNKTRENWKKDFKSKKYVYIKMGFGNGLCVDKSIYDEFFEFLFEEAKKSNLYDGDAGKDYNVCINFSIWQEAMEKMFESKEINLKKIIYENWHL